MTKKNKNHSDTENLKGIIRKQEKIIRSLKKETSRSSKKQQQVQDYIEELEQELDEDDLQDPPVKNDDKCPECKKGYLEIVDLGIRKMILCGACNYRKIRK